LIPFQNSEPGRNLVAGHAVGLIKLSGMEIELGSLLGRRAELHTVKGLNPNFRDEVLKRPR